MSCKQAPFSIDFIIIGAGENFSSPLDGSSSLAQRASFGSAGVTGLATALRLRQSGHRVTVVDKGVGPSEVCLSRHPSVQFPPYNHPSYVSEKGRRSSSTESHQAPHGMGFWKTTEEIWTVRTSKQVSIRWVLAHPHLRYGINNIPCSQWTTVT